MKRANLWLLLLCLLFLAGLLMLAAMERVTKQPVEIRERETREMPPGG